MERAVAIRPPRAEGARVHDAAAVEPSHVDRPRAAEFAAGENGEAVRGAVRQYQRPAGCQKEAGALVGAGVERTTVQACQFARSVSDPYLLGRQAQSHDLLFGAVYVDR